MSKIKKTKYTKALVAAKGYDRTGKVGRISKDHKKFWKTIDPLLT